MLCSALIKQVPLLGNVLRQQGLVHRGFWQERCLPAIWMRYHCVSPEQQSKLATQPPPKRSKKPATLPTDTNTTNPLFADLDTLESQIKKNLSESLRIERMTDIQAQTYQPQLERSDLIGIAPDRAGKTLAFLLPFIHERMKYAGTKESGTILRRNNDIHMILLTSAPVYARALHQDISNVFAHMGPFLTVQQCHEDQHPSLEMSRLAKKYPTILITTPTRFLHHMEHSFMRRRRKRNVRGFKRKKTSFASLIGPTITALVLDEADRCVASPRAEKYSSSRRVCFLRSHVLSYSLVSRYSKEITDILDVLPGHPERHTVAFSTTYPTGITDIPGLLQPNNLVTVDCSEQRQRIEFIQSKGLKKRMRLRVRMEQRDLTEPLSEQEPVSLHTLLYSHTLPLYALERALANRGRRRREWEQLLEARFAVDEETEQMAPLYELWRRMQADSQDDNDAHSLRLLTLLVMRKVKAEGYLSQFTWTEDIQKFLQKDPDETAPPQWEKWMSEMNLVEEQMATRQRVSRTTLHGKRKHGLLTPSEANSVALAGTSTDYDSSGSSDEEGELTDRDQEFKGSSD